MDPLFFIMVVQLMITVYLSAQVFLDLPIIKKIQEPK